MMLHSNHPNHVESHTNHLSQKNEGIYGVGRMPVVKASSSSTDSTTVGQMKFFWALWGVLSITWRQIQNCQQFLKA